MKLLTGPAGSGKTHVVLGRVRELLRARRTGFRLLVPTATMAEHVRNSLAREGFVFSPGFVLTFTKFVSSQFDTPSDLPAGALELAVRSCLEARTPESFASVAGLAGFERTLAGLIRDCSSAGCDASRLAASGLDHPYLTDFVELFDRIQHSLAARGWNLRGATLREAVRQIEANRLPGIEEVLFDGFFQFTEPELDVIAAVSHAAAVTVTLPDWPGASFARRSLLAQGFTETHLGPSRRNPEVTVLEAPTISAETEVVAARILEATRQGHAFRDIGVVVRGDNAYIPALRTALARFEIPAAFLFGEPLAAHAAVRYLTALIKAMLGGWDHAETLAALRLAPSGLGGTRAGDSLDYQVREALPGRGLAALEALPGAAEPVARLRELEADLAGTATPEEWSRRCARLRRLIALPASLEVADHALALLWRSIPAALASVESAARETAVALGDRPAMPFAEFWEQFHFVLEEETLRVPDRRRDVVHVMDVYEARQWALPVIFVCGLLEKEFPRYHQQDPLLPDALRLQLQDRGIRLRTSSDHQVEENFLFDLAATRATARLFLCYPRYNAKGDENLRSFLLDSYLERHPMPVQSVTGARPEPRNRPSPLRMPSIDDAGLRSRLAARHARLAPTSVETYLQCAYRFFAGNSLRLHGAPAAPEERLDIPAQGNIIHAVLADWARWPQEWRPLFERHWAAECRKLDVVPGYHSESVRLELLRNLEMLMPKLDDVPDGPSDVERRFTIRLSGELTIGGKIDRVIHRPDGTVLILDYKYASPENVRKLIASHEAGLVVQGGLYLIAAEEDLQVRPGGFLYCGTKKQVVWHGWHTLSDVTLTGPCEPQDLRLVMEQARARTLDVYRQIGEGQIVPRPADPAKCGFCDFADICRQETVPVTIPVEEGGL